MTISTAATLHNGVEMPYLGFGTFKASSGGEVEQAIEWALQGGYRSFDTASVYNNEEGVGRALRESGVPREELFVTTKVWNDAQGFESTLRAFDASLERLGMDYVDLYLIHWPQAGRSVDTWKALEKLYAEKRARAIGVSNFLVHHLEALLAETEVVPMVNQVEFHPRLVLPELQDYCRRKQIQLEAWSPIMRGRVNDIPELQAVAEAHGKTPAQVVLRWDIQHGVVTIPKSVKRSHIEENADIFDFALTDEEMATIDGLDQDDHLGPHPDAMGG
jgi:diketogulonate reductase-like aldo/keto reductase